MNQENINEFERVINSNYSNIAGINVQKSGIKAYERYFNGYTSDTAFHVFSVTKSIISALIGIAIDKGYIGSIDHKVLDFSRITHQNEAKRRRNASQYGIC